MNNSSSSDRDPLERLADDFLDRRRRGEDPSPSEYARRFPQWAEQILEFFPALEVIEGLKPGAEDLTDSIDRRNPSPPATRLEQLGEYRILREIGHGGMGVVYEAMQESLGRRVALKILPLHGRIDPVQIERFRLESRSAARLHHGNIVPVHGMGEHQGVYYYAMQYIQGHGLDVILADLRRLKVGVADNHVEDSAGSLAVARSLLTGRLGEANPAEGTPTVALTLDGGTGIPDNGPASGASPGAVSSSVLSHSTESGYYHAVARLGVQVAQALAHAHGQGVLHRDIKPSNLLLDVAGHVWVTDFGLAKLEGSDGPTQTGDILGTLRYMAPERFEGWSDRRGDIYGLGMTLYEMLTLRPAFDAATRAKLIDQVIHDPPPAPRKLDRQIPRDLETIVLKAIAKEPAERYPTAESLAVDLENYLGDRPIVARRSSLPEQAWRWCRRNPSTAGLLAATIVAALALMALFVALSFQSRLEAARADAEKQRGIAETALVNERTFLYSNRALSAARELVDHNPLRAEGLLQECPLDLRGWEWHFLKRQCHKELLAIDASKSQIMQVAFTPDGKRLISIDNEGVVKIWEVATGRLLQEHEGYRKSTSSIAFSPDGLRYATSSGSRSQLDPVLIRDPGTGRVVRELRCRTGNLSSVSFNTDGRILVIGAGEKGQGNSIVVLADPETGQERLRIETPGEPVYRASISPDGTRLLATVGGATSFEPAGKLNRVVVWDVRTRQELFRIPAHRAPILPSRMSPDGKTIVTGDYDGNVRVWDAMNGRLLRELEGHPDCVNEVVFSHDGRSIASASDDNTVIIWDSSTYKALFQFSGHQGGIWNLAFSPDNLLLATCGYDGQIKLWDATRSRDSRVLTTAKASGRVSGLAFSRAGDLLAAGCGDRVVRLWRLPVGQLKAELIGHREAIWGVAVSTDSRWIASCGGDSRQQKKPGEVNLWDAKTGRLVHSLKAHRGIAWTVAFSPDGSQLASGGGETYSRDDQIIIWNVSSGEVVRTIPCSDGGCTSLAFSPDGAQICTAAGGYLKTWDPATGQAVLTLPERLQAEGRIAYRPDGSQLAFAGADLRIALWNTQTGELASRLLGHSFRVSDLVFSPDSHRLASVGDRFLKIYDPGVGQQLLSMVAHDSRIWSVAFSPDGHMIATGDEQGIIKLWDGSPLEGGPERESVAAFNDRP